MSNEQKGRIDRTRKTAQRVIGSELTPTQSRYDKRLLGNDQNMGSRT